MASDEVYEKFKIFNSFIKDRIRGGQLSSALALKKEHMAHIKEALSRGDITREQHDALIEELESMRDEEGKKCPRCEASVRGNAKVCFKCGFSFEELVFPEKREPIIEIPIPQPGPKSEYKPASSKGYLLIGAVAAIIIISFGLLAGLYMRGVIPPLSQFTGKISQEETYPPFVPPQTMAPETPSPETPPPIAALPPIAISRIQAQAPDPTGEYIEIYNTTDKTLEVTGWTITDSQNNVFKFPKFFLQPGRKVKIHTGQGSSTLVNLYWGLSKFVWDDTGDTITVKDASENLVIEVSY